MKFSYKKTKIEHGNFYEFFFQQILAVGLGKNMNQNQEQPSLDRNVLVLVKKTTRNFEIDCFPIQIQVRPHNHLLLMMNNLPWGPRFQEKNLRYFQLSIKVEIFTIKKFQRIKKLYQKLTYNFKFHFPKTASKTRKVRKRFSGF